MYFLLGFFIVMSSMTYLVVNNSNSRAETHATVNAQYEKKMDENQAYWDAFQERYSTFDTLKSTTSPKHVPGQLRGYWLNSNQSGNLLHIDDDSVQTEYKMNARAKCYKKGSSRDLLYYGDVYYVSKKRSSEYRYHYSFESLNSLSTEMIFNNGKGAVDNYRRVYFSNSDKSRFCS